MQVKDLSKFDQNPRTISVDQQRILAKGLAEYGDLSGVVWNVRKKQLVGGNQRTDAFSPDDKIEYTQKFQRPDNQGTVALGYIVHKGKKYNYREVAWNQDDHVAASLLANKGGGDWDWVKVQDLIFTLPEGFDKDLTGFQPSEIQSFLDNLGTEGLAPDYSALKGESVDSQIKIMSDGVRKAIQIEFLPEDYDRAAKVINYWRAQNAYIGKMVIDDLEKRMPDQDLK